MKTPAKPHLRIARARSLRSESTLTESLLWAVLRDRQLDGMKFRRQVVIGKYIADFCCIDAKLVIEVDGSQHEDQQTYDAARTAHLSRNGYRVLRFWNADVLTGLEGVVEIIREELKKGAD